MTTLKENLARAASLEQCPAALAAYADFLNEVCDERAEMYALWARRRANHRKLDEADEARFARMVKLLGWLDDRNLDEAGWSITDMSRGTARTAKKAWSKLVELLTRVGHPAVRYISLIRMEDQDSTDAEVNLWRLNVYMDAGTGLWHCLVGRSPVLLCQYGQANPVEAALVGLAEVGWNFDSQAVDFNEEAVVTLKVLIVPWGDCKAHTYFPKRWWRLLDWWGYVT